MVRGGLNGRLVTSQNDATPKLTYTHELNFARLVTSQNDATPKRVGVEVLNKSGLVTSQNDATPKLLLASLGFR